MNEEGKCDLRERIKAFALRVVRLYASLPKTTEAQVLGKQILRSGTSVGAHYREAKRARSTAEFISKVEGGLPELEETTYWLELLADSGIIPSSRLSESAPRSRRTDGNPRPLRQNCETTKAADLIFIVHRSAFIVS